MKTIALGAAIASLALAPSANAAPHNYHQELTNILLVITVCGHIGHCRDLKLIERTHPGNCTREKWRLYPLHGPARILITKACG